MSSEFFSFVPPSEWEKGTRGGRGEGNGNGNGAKLIRRRGGQGDANSVDVTLMLAEGIVKVDLRSDMYVYLFDLI